MGRDPRPIDVSAQATGPTVAADHRLAVAPDDAGGYQFGGGAPRWLQNPEVPEEGYRFLIQLDADQLPFPINFSVAGMGYVFLSPDRREGRFLLAELVRRAPPDEERCPAAGGLSS